MILRYPLIFLDRDDGIFIEVYYTGEDSDISCSGTIKGARDGIQERTQLVEVMPPFGSGAMKTTSGMLLSALAGLIFACILIFMNVRPKSGHLKIDYPQVIFGAVFLVFAVAAISNSLRYYLKERVPKEFKNLVMNETVT